MANPKGYKKELGFDEDLATRRTLEALDILIEKRIVEYFEKNSPKYLVGTITDVAIDNSTGDVLLAGGTLSIPALKNKTNETLNIGDEVYILLLKAGNTTNSVIAIKK